MKVRSFFRTPKGQLFLVFAPIVVAAVWSAGLGSAMELLIATLVSAAVDLPILPFSQASAGIARNKSNNHGYAKEKLMRLLQKVRSSPERQWAQFRQSAAGPNPEALSVHSGMVRAAQISPGRIA